MDKTDFYKGFAGCLLVKNGWGLIRKRPVLAFSFSIFCLPLMAHGDDHQYWANPAPSGTWHTTSWAFNSDGSGGLFPWTDGQTAVFSATNPGAPGNFTVTLDSSVTVQDLTYTGGNKGSTLQIAAGAGTITPLGEEMNVTIDAGTTLIVNPAITPTDPTTTLVLTGGTLVLKGANTFSYKTDIYLGATLVADSNQALGTSQALLFGGTLIIPSGVTLTNAVAFVGGGTLDNAGTLNNNVGDEPIGTASVLINSGQINGNVKIGGFHVTVQLFTGSQIAGNLTLGGFLPNLGVNPASIGVPKATLILDGAGQQLLSQAVLGTITNSGSLVKQGTGTWTIDRPLAAPTGTEILDGILAVDVTLATPMVTIAQGGALQLNNGGNVGSFVDNGSLIFARSDTFTFNQTINGSGNVVQNGLGTTILSAANTYSGGTVVELGTLVVDNPQALGTGNVTVSGGILTADPQPINVKGNYTQTAGGTLQLNVAGGNPGQYDTLNVGGNATLGGTLKLISLGSGFQPKAGEQLTLVTAGGSVSGRFAQVVDSLAGPGFTFANLVYEPDAVLLEFRTAASFALTPNQLAAASLIDAVHLEPSAANLMSFLSAQPLANLPNAFQQISPDGLTAFYEISFSNSNIQRFNLEGRLDDLHNGSNGFSSNMKVNGATVNLEDRADANGVSSKAVVEPVLQHTAENRWGVWVTGFGDFVNVDGDGNSQGYNFTTGGVSIGVDYRITDQLAIGVMGDYSHTWTSLNPSGNIDVNSGRGGLYATWYNHGVYLDAAIYAGHNSYSSSRSGLEGLADGNTGGTEWSTFLSGGYDFHFGPLTVGPIGALQYTYANVSGFSENGSLAPMQIQSDSADSLRTDVGFRLFYQWQIGKILLGHYQSLEG
jgi:autotransporter-associated beta strand protein